MRCAPGEVPARRRASMPQHNEGGFAAACLVEQVPYKSRTKCVCVCVCARARYVCMCVSSKKHHSAAGLLAVPSPFQAVHTMLLLHLST